ncbi:class I SAM-dependent methyltransferase [Wenxinia saemankumensis]|uniref:Predicted nicotinamide N-methyase n=1 Tax=Wenxinia saemankumensis TaxID=1447782 RepID=A0A1M6C3W1_9RHOB|nr:50S ribosomal protein L11 methyltransferase [Wenxinia saemankumensis]SHI55710.1 Predicted nicotinamide N-methyase [Wenxinia saemankumensis]
MAFDFGDRTAFIARELRVEEIAGTGGLRIWRAHARSDLARLGRLTGRVQPYPYWAHPWPGGIGMAAWLMAEPGRVAGRRVLDIGAGSGLVAIAAARSGAARVTASDIDPMAEAATWLNAGLNGVEVGTTGDVLSGPARDDEVVLVGDTFYDTALGLRVLAYLRRAQLAGATIYVGDIGRAGLPGSALRPVARLAAPDIGDPPGAPPRAVTIHRLG